MVGSNRSRANEREEVSNPTILQTVLGFFIAWLGPLGEELRTEVLTGTMSITKE